MRIAFLSGEYPPQPGGIGDYTRRLATALLAREHTVFVFTIHDSRFTIRELPDNRQSKIVNPKSNWGWRMWRDVVDALDATRPDVLHIEYQTGAFAMRPAVNFLPWRVRRLTHRPSLVVTAHDLLVPYLFPKAGPLRAWVTQRLLTDADAVVVTNVADYAQIRSKYTNEVTLIPIGSNIAVDPPAGYNRVAWRTGLGVSEHEILVAYFGLMSHTKGLDSLLDAFTRLPAHVKLLVIGGAAVAPEDRVFAAEIERRIVADGLSSRVLVTGHCAEQDVSAHFLAADVAALPFTDGASFRRGSLLAALAHGVPTVTTQPLPIAENINLPSFRDGENVLLVPPRAPDALATAIARLANDDALRSRLAAGGRTLAAYFGWDAIAAQHEALYDRLPTR